MKSADKYRLQSLFVLREKELENSRRFFAAALEESRACRDRVKKAEKTLAKKKEELQNILCFSQSGSLRVQDFMFRESLEKKLKEELQAAASALSMELKKQEMALKRENDAAAGVRRAQEELKILERHREKWERKKKETSEKLHDEMMEEAVVSRWEDVNSELRKREK